MEPFNWQCPFCKHNSVVTDKNIQFFGSIIRIPSKYETRTLHGAFISCANSECKEITLDLNISTQNEQDGRFANPVGDPHHTWKLIPESSSKIFPDYIPEPLRQDYLEACLIADRSPKASATLARRCLQGMIRDFWNVNDKKNLFEEIESIRDRVDAETWDAIDSLRKLGNIGAHMEKDINLIVDVDSGEAAMLIQLIETLFEEWYISRHDRQQKMAQIKMIATEKDAERKGAK